MKRLTCIAICAALAVGACGKKNQQQAGGAAQGSAGSAGSAAAGAPTGPADLVPGIPPAAANAVDSAAAAAGEAAATAGEAATAAQTAAQTAVANVKLTAEQVDDIGGKLLSVMDGVAGAVEGNATDCTKMAAAVEKVVADNQAALADIHNVASGTENDALVEAWMAKTRDRAQALTNRIRPGLEKCQSDAGLRAAFQKLDM
ncbi:MAG TPA: hypothetical protein VHE35_12830 [Kofleriaceae bacterium]|nr:hypothetical protein [Kofleriaceae bacterium]